MSVTEATAARILAFSELDSTNAHALRLAALGEEGPVWITAQRQSAGRGRRGRIWETGPGNLAATLLTTTAKPPARAAEMAFVAAVAVADLVDSVVPPGLAGLKWPNDVLVAQRKVSGVLIESERRSDGRLWLAVGVGVNLATSPTAADRPATNLGAHLREGLSAPPSPEAALRTLASRFDHYHAMWEREGFAPIRHRWLQSACGLGGPCRVQLDREILEGVAEGLDNDGAFHLRLADSQLRRIVAGDVFFGAF